MHATTVPVGYTLEGEVNAAYSAFQECGTREGARLILEVLESNVLRELCHLAYVEVPSGGFGRSWRERTAERLMADRWRVSA